MATSIDKLRFWCQKVLPLVYDESLSYYEVLCKVAEKLNESITQLNALSDKFDNYDTDLSELSSRITAVEDSMDGLVAEVEQRFTTLQTSLEQEIADTDAELSRKIDTKLAEVDSRIVIVDNKINELDAKVEREIEELQTLIESTLNEATASLTQLIEDEVRELNRKLAVQTVEIQNWVNIRLQEFLDEIPTFENVIVKNPTNGQLEDIQKVIDDIFNSYRWGALTAKEYDDLGLTAEQYDNCMVEGIPRGLTAIQYDVFARRYLWVDPNVRTMHPTKGVKVLMKEVVALNTDLIRTAGCLSASEYDSVGLSAGEYDALGLTAYQYDWHSNSLIQ